MQIIRIIAVIVDVRELTMYRDDGETIIIKQGDPRIRPLVDKTVPELRRLKLINEQRKAAGRTDFVPVYIDLTSAEVNEAPTFQQDHTHFAEAEKKMGGVVKFFRMAKSKLKELAQKFSGAEAEPVEEIPLTGDLPVAAPTVAFVVPAQIQGRAKEQEPDESENDLPLTKSMDAVNEIMANAIPSHAPEFTAQAKDETTTVVAVTEDGTIIPGMEQLDIQLRQTASKLGSPVGILKFFERVSSVERGHTVQDLLKFMEKGELPIADDGSILVYKRLMSTSEPGVFVDCHSKKVKQKVGSHVFMDEKLVDANRRTECSNGLHVARRDYLSSFSGDVTVLAKLAPEDVIAVPHADARKLRAKGYFIIAQLSKTDANAVCNNRKLTDTNLLGNAVAGNHTPILETVQITSSYGGGLIITPVGEGQESEVIMNGALHAEPLKDEADFIAENSAVDAREVAKEVFTAPPGGAFVCTVDESCGEATPPPAPKYEAKAVVTLSKVGQLVADFENASTPETKRAAAIALVDHKKSVKKSWTALGVPAAIFDDAVNRAAATVKPTEVAKADYKPAKAKKPAAVVKAKVKADGKVAVTAKAAKGADLRDVIGKPAAKSPMVKEKQAAEVIGKGLKKPNPLAGSKLDSKPAKALSKADQIRVLLLKGPLTVATAKEILAIKKAAKKSWEILGVTMEEEDSILKLAK